MRCPLRAAMDWHFEAEGKEIHWDFVGEKREAIGKIKAGQVLQVRMNVTPLSRGGGSRGGDWGGVLTDAAYRMVQRIRLNGVWKAFRDTVMPRLAVFWKLNRALALSPDGSRLLGFDHRKGSYAFLADALQQPAIDGIGDKRPEPGVYVRGIWVQRAVIKGTILSFDARCGVQVGGRDRNSVSVVAPFT